MNTLRAASPWWIGPVVTGFAIGQALQLTRARDIFLLFWALFWLTFGLTLKLSEPVDMNRHKLCEGCYPGMPWSGAPCPRCNCAACVQFRENNKGQTYHLQSNLDSWSIQMVAQGDDPDPDAEK